MSSSAGAFTLGNSADGLNVALSGNQTWTNGNSVTVFTTASSNTITNASSATPATLTLSGPGAFAFKGDIVNNGAGTVAFTDNNTALVTLSGTNSYSGATAINSGTMEFTTTNAMSSSSAISVAGTGTLAIELGGGTGSFTLATSGAGSLGNIFAGTGGGGITYASGASVGVDTNGISGTYTAALADNGSGAIHMGLVKLGTGTLALTGTSTYSGQTTISGGSLQLGNGSTTGKISTTGTIVDNGTFVIDRSNAVAQGTDFSSSAITGSGGFIQLGTGTTTLNAANSFSGTTVITAGRLQLGTGGTTGSLAGTGSITDNATFAVDRSNAVVQGIDFSSKVISGTGTFVQIGSGTTTLNAANTYSGGTTISSGALIVTNGSGVGTGTVTVASGAALNYDAASDAHLAVSGINITGGTNTTIGGSIGSNTTTSEIAVTNAVTTSGGNLTVNIYGESGVTPLSGTNTYTLIGTGLSSTWGVPTLGTVYNNTNFTVGALSNTTTSLNVLITSQTGLTSAYWQGGLSGNPTVWAASDGSATSNWVATLGGSQQALVPGSTTTVFISDTGSITPPTATTLGANMSIAGLVIQDTVNGLGLNADGNTLTIGSGGITMNASVPASSIGANVALGAAQTWTNNSANALTVGGVVSGTTTSNLTTAGTGTIILTGADTYTGTTTINSGSALQIGNGGTTGSIASSGSLTDNGTLVYDLSTSVNQSAVTGAHAISGSGNIILSGTGTVSLNEAGNSFTGGIIVLKGELQLGTSGDAGATTSTITLGDGSTDNATIFLSGNGNSLANAINLAANSTGTLLLTTGSNVTFTGSITLGGGGTNLTVGPTGQGITLTGGISGTGNVILATDSSFGAVQITGTSTSINNTGAITIINGNSTTGGVLISSVIGTNVTGVTQNTGGMSVLSGVNTFFGDTTVDSGTLVLSAGAGTGTFAATSSSAVQHSVVNMDGGTVAFGTTTGTITSATMGGLAGSGNLNLVNAATTKSAVNLTIGNSNASNGSGSDPNTLNPIYSGILSNTTGNASVTKVGSNSQTFSGANTYSGGTTVSGGTLVLANTSGSATGTGSLTVGANATLAGTGTSTGTGFSVSGTGTATGARANLLVGMTSASDTNTSSTLTLLGSGNSTIQNASLTFNLNVQVPGALGSNPANSGTELAVGGTNVSFGTGAGSVQLALNMQNEPGFVAAYTPYVLVAGTGVTTDTGGVSGGQYTGLTLGTVTNLGGGVTETLITGSNFALAFSGANDEGNYGANSYLVLYQSAGVDDIDVIVVPEPGTWAMMLGGLGILVLLQRRKQRRAGI